MRRWGRISRWIGPTQLALGRIAANPSLAAALKGDCPDNYVVHAGLNTDIPHAGEKRAFLVYPPEGVRRALRRSSCP